MKQRIHACSCCSYRSTTASSSPGMTATIAADVGDAEQVFVLPRPDGEYGTHRHDRRGGRHRPAARRDQRGHAHRPAPRARRHRLTGAQRRARDRGRAARRRRPRRRRDPRARAQLPRGGRGDPRAARRRRPGRGLPALDLRARPARRHLRLQPRHLARRQAAAARDRRRHRAARAGARAAARAARRAPGPHADPRRRRVRRPGPAARVLPAQADGVDPQGAGRGRRLGRRGVPDQDRRVGDARGRPRAGQARARPARAHGRVERASPR